MNMPSLQLTVCLVNCVGVFVCAGIVFTLSVGEEKAPVQLVRQSIAPELHDVLSVI